MGRISGYYFIRAMSAAVIAGVVGACATESAHHGASAYAGQQSRDIKALSEAEIRSYLDGSGMGLAKAAELNRYPGPMHALELGSALDLTASQRASLQSLMRAHKAEVRGLGAEVVRLERELDRQFAGRTATPASVDAQLERIGAAQARVRGSHLKTHLATAAILSPAQVEQYVGLRGYLEHSGSE